jgi:hypothetical protein
MIVKSIKFVNLFDNNYKGLWSEFNFIIPFVGEDVEIPLNKGNPNDPKWIMATVKDNSLSFEVE